MSTPIANSRYSFGMLIKTFHINPKKWVEIGAYFSCTKGEEYDSPEISIGPLVLNSAEEDSQSPQF